ncbi:MAG: Glycine cleavage system H protein [Candidatus Argoarchaeum ethanivorans]|uniref:Probable glycine cleavage system H protein n=1 Tax=Candidatus Argoarchaeum ethanivorans TaxID=2608793 RepID=A0A812A2R3_9EURY|nr:MAG: Glycine cleavage system H protein [Candidatus Argoarchaeum ethanivorans]
MVSIEEYELPDELYYVKDHTYARVEDDGTVTVGMDDFGVKGLHEIEFIDLPIEDDEFEANDAFGSIESAKWVGGLLMPVSGTVIEVNEELDDTPSLLIECPYGDGWLIKVKPSNLEEDLKELIHGEEVVLEWIKKEIAER